MKANFLNTFLTTVSIVTALSYAGSASAGDKKNRYTAGELTGPHGTISQTGLDTGLELYDFDIADRCILGKLQIRATFNNISQQGILKAELFAQKDFMKSKGKLRRIRVPAKDGPQQICIDVPTPGEYAVVGYHDKDGNRHLKKAWNFKPKEPYGLSNNPKIESLRLPKWSETRFDVPMNGVNITIDLVDP